jgi:hypothetical protein
MELFSNFLGGTLIVSLNGDAKEAQSVIEGRYLLHEDNEDWKDKYWIQDNGSNVIWYYPPNWIIGNQDDRGRDTQFAAIYSTDHFSPNPLLVSNWAYKASNGKWTRSDNVHVGPGNVYLSLVCYLYTTCSLGFIFTTKSVL